MSAQQDEIITFWREAGKERWYAKDDAFDAEIRTRFLSAHEAAARGEYWTWERQPHGALALIILLDQFPRNLFRDSAHAFATDAAALGVAERAIARGDDRREEGLMRQFFYLPFMHSENLGHQERCVALFDSLGDEFEENKKYAVVHRDVIARFGRFPHRNPVFGRKTTPEEGAYLDGGGFAG